jgi:hypothetical protein
MSDVFVVPLTSPLQYPDGKAALNLPSPTGTGDWHMGQSFFRKREKLSRSFISGVGCATDTTALLGNAGVFDCKALLDELKIAHAGDTVYAANHARAIADLALGAVMRGESPAFVRLDDYMPRDSDRQQVFDLLAVAMRGLPEDQQQKVYAWQGRQRPSPENAHETLYGVSACGCSWIPSLPTSSSAT